MAGAFGLRIWGARGSLPRMVRGQERHGGNTVCLEVLHPGAQRLILDAGTGLPNLGTRILEESPSGEAVHLFLSHYHWDHVLGLPLFGPVYREGFDIHLYGMHAERGALREMLDMVFHAAYSPIYGPENLLSNLILPEQAACHDIDGVSVRVVDIAGIHPGGCLVFRLSCEGASMVYAPDVELQEAAVIDPFLEVCDGCDLLICGTSLSQERFAQGIGYGHSSLEIAHEMGARAGVGRVMGIHFDPLCTDAELEEARALQQARIPGIPLELACEGCEVSL